MNFEYERYHVHTYGVNYGMFGADFDKTYLEHWWNRSPSIYVINPFYSGNPLTSTFANSEDSDEMQHNA